MSNNPISKLYLLSKSFIKSNFRVIVISLIFTIIVFIAGFLLGVDREFQSSVSKDLFYYGDYYLKVAESEKVNQFRVNARKAEHEWKVFHVNPSRITERDTSLALATEVKKEYFDLNFDYLTPSWKLYAYYHYAYLNLICADIEGSKSCHDEMESALKAIDKIKLSTQEDNWYQKNSIKRNIDILKVQFAAVGLINDSDSKLKQNAAISALMSYGTKKQIDNQNLYDDRLIGVIYKLAYPKGYKIPE